MTDQHSQWGPSGAERWMVCTASVQESIKAPHRPPRPSAEEGSHAHKVLEYCLINQIATARDCVGKLLVPAQGPVTTEMCDAVQEALDEVHHIMSTDPNAQLWVEVTVKLPTPQNPDHCWGTADIVIWLPMMRTLYVVDFKYGMLVKEAKDNPQLKSYGAGTIFGEPLKDVLAVEPWLVVLGIIQPRAYHYEGPVRYWNTDVATLRDWLPQVDNAITETKGPNPQYFVDEDVCRFCEGHLTCKALQAKSLALAGEAFKDVRAVQPRLLPAPEQVSMDHVSNVLKGGKVLKKWLQSFEDFALEQARAGIYVPGHKLVQSTQRRAFPKGKDMETAFEIISISEDDLTLDDVYPRQLVTITEMEKLLKQPAPGKKTRSKAEKQRRMDAFAHVAVKQPSKSFTVVPEDDSRPAVNLAQLAFANVSVPET